MSALREIIEYVVSAAADVQDFPVMIGPLPAPESVSVAYGSGGTDTTMLDKGVVYDLSLVVNGKSADQAGILDAIATIHQALVQTKDYPEGHVDPDDPSSSVAWQIADISSSETPDYIGREEEDMYLYGSTLRVRAWLLQIPIL